MHVIVILLCSVADIAIFFGEGPRELMTRNPAEYWGGAFVINLVLFGAIKWLQADLRASD